MKVIIAGSRKIRDKELVFRFIDEFREEREITEIICGMAKGVDLLGKAYGQQHGIPVIEFPWFDWEGYIAGPPLRNQRMANYAQENGGGLLLIWDGLSSGSKDMLFRAKRARPRIFIMNVDLSQPRLT